MDWSLPHAAMSVAVSRVSCRGASTLLHCHAGAPLRRFSGVATLRIDSSNSSGSGDDDAESRRRERGIAYTADLLARLVQRLDKKLVRQFEGRPLVNDVDFTTASLDAASQFADYHYSGGRSPFAEEMEIQLLGRPVTVLYTNEAGQINRWIDANVLAPGLDAIGFDTEQRPSLWGNPSTHAKRQGLDAAAAAAANACAVIQLATRDAVLVAHLGHLRCAKSLASGGDGKRSSQVVSHHPIGYFGTGAPKSLLALLRSGAVRLVGVNVGPDVSLLLRSLRLNMQHQPLGYLQGSAMPTHTTTTAVIAHAGGSDSDSGAIRASSSGGGKMKGVRPNQCPVVDIDQFARDLGIRRSGGGSSHGLELLAHKYLGLPRWKTGALSLSNWSHAPLSPRQIRYAAMDAWAGNAVYCALRELAVCTTGPPGETSKSGKPHTPSSRMAEVGVAVSQLKEAFSYLWHHDVAMLPSHNALHKPWLARQCIEVEEYGTSPLCKSPFPRTRNGRLQVHTAAECAALGINRPLLVSTFQSRAVNNAQPAVSDAWGAGHVAHPPPTECLPPDVDVEADDAPASTPVAQSNDFWQSDRMHVGARAIIEYMQIP